MVGVAVGGARCRARLAAEGEVKVEVWKRKRKRKRCGSRSGDHTLSLGIKQLIVERDAMQSRDRSYLCGPKGRAQRLLLSAWAEAVRAMHPVVRGWATTEVGWRMRGRTLRGKEPGSEWLAQSVQVGASRAVQVGRCESSPAVVAVQLEGRSRFVFLGKVDW